MTRAFSLGLLFVALQVVNDGQKPRIFDGEVAVS